MDGASARQEMAQEEDQVVREGVLVDIGEPKVDDNKLLPEDDDGSWRAVQEQRPFCASGPDCANPPSGSVQEAEHYVTYRHTALNKKEKKEMEDRREEEQYRAQEAKKEDKKTSGGGPRLMDFLGRRKENDSKRAKDEARKEKEREDSSGKSVITEPPTTTTHTTSPSSVSIKGKDTVSGFTLKKIFGKKGENEDTVGEDLAAVASGNTTMMTSLTSPRNPAVSMVSPILSMAPEGESQPQASTGTSSDAVVESIGDTPGGARPTEAHPTGMSSWMALRRMSLTGKIEELKKKIQTTHNHHSDQQVVEEQNVDERIAVFRKAAEELDALEKELEQVLAMGDSFYVWQSQKKRLIEVTPQSEVVACELLYQSPFMNEWGPISSQVNFKSSLLSSGPSYSSCRVRMLTKHGKQINSIAEAATSDDLLFEVKLATSVRYSDEIKSFSTDDRISIRKSAPKGMGFKIEWKNGTRDQWYADDGEGLAKVMYYHLRAYNLRRAKQVGRLRGLWCLACTAYDSNDKQHEDELVALWQTVFPDTKLNGRVSSQWKQLGFQGNDPATDFRGMGLLGLTTLLYFARHYSDTLSSLLKQGRSYPWASAGINLTQMLFKSLKLDESLIRAAENSESWDTPLFHFMTTRENEEERNLFEEVFCVIFLLFDRVWVSSSAGYMDFPTVLNKVSQMFEETLQQRPKSISNLYQRQMLACEAQFPLMPTKE